jgi:hypothetical protein
MNKKHDNKLRKSGNTFSGLTSLRFCLKEPFLASAKEKCEKSFVSRHLPIISISRLKWRPLMRVDSDVRPPVCRQIAMKLMFDH